VEVFDARDGGKPGEDGEHEELVNQWACNDPPGMV